MDRGALKKISRPVFLGLGILLAVHVVRSSGIGETVGMLRSAGPWIPLLVVLQIGVLACDVTGLHFLIAGTAKKGEPMPSAKLWLRGTLIGFAWATVLPGGRAAGEAIRASLFAEEIGAGRAAGAAARQQACSLVGTGVVCVLASAVILLFANARVLGLLVLANAAVVWALAAAIFYVVRHVGKPGRIHDLLAKLVDNPHDSVAPSREATLRAIGCCSAARLVQTVQCGLGLAAIGIHPGVVKAFTAQGVQIVGVTAGDLVPGQLGVFEEVYHTFAEALGVGHEPARALSLAIVIRAALWTLAAIGGVVGLLTPRKATPRTSPKKADPAPAE